MSLWDHLEELRKRIIWSLLAIALTGGVALYFGDEVFHFFIKPLGDIELHVTTITASFYSYVIVSALAGFFVSAPFVFYQMWRFVAPGLYVSEKRMLIPAITISTLLFLIGAGFCFKIILPYSITYLISYGEGLFTPIITVDSYLSFAGWMMIAFGAGFNMPVVAFFTAKMGLVTPEALAKGRRIAFVAILIFAAIITPPDVMTQLLLSAPLYLLYEISIVVVRVVVKRENND